MPVDVTSYLQCINIHKGKNSDHKLGFRDGMKSLFMQEGLREELLILKIERSQLEVAQFSLLPPPQKNHKEQGQGK